MLLDWFTKIIVKFRLCGDLEDSSKLYCTNPHDMHHCVLDTLAENQIDDFS